MDVFLIPVATDRYELYASCRTTTLAIPRGGAADSEPVARFGGLSRRPSVRASTRSQTSRWRARLFATSRARFAGSPSRSPSSVRSTCASAECVAVTPRTWPPGRPPRRPCEHAIGLRSIAVGRH
jgi:hypothetical protein